MAVFNKIFFLSFQCNAFQKLWNQVFPMLVILDVCIDQAKLGEFEEKASELNKKVSNYLCNIVCEEPSQDWFCGHAFPCLPPCSLCIDVFFEERLTENLSLCIKYSFRNRKWVFYKMIDFNSFAPLQFCFPLISSL